MSTAQLNGGGTIDRSTLRSNTNPNSNTVPGVATHRKRRCCDVHCNNLWSIWYEKNYIASFWGIRINYVVSSNVVQLQFINHCSWTNVSSNERYFFNLAPHISQCGNFRIFLSLWFYVKSILENLEGLKLPFVPFLWF